MHRFITSTLLAALTLVPSHGQEKDLANLPEHLTPLPYAGIRNWHITQNLGPTGARAWVYGHINDTNESRELLVKSIEPGSPADGILQPYDVIVGAAIPPETPASTWAVAPMERPFDSDARLSFARAVTWAESDAGRGQLKLLRSRNGKTETVTITLPVMGTYTDTVPLDCPKSQKIVENAAEFLADQMPTDGYPAGVGRPHNAGFLLATHDPKYLDHVRRSAMRMSLLHTITDAGHETWRWGNTNTFLCEYYLATGDERVLSTIREYAQVLQDGQCNPGTWGHRSVPDYVPPGYGSVNSTGVICFFSIVLANQCGINVADEAIKNSIRFYGGYAGRGSIPYGDHPPHYATTANGKNGVAALAFHILGADPAAQWFARLCASSNLVNFEGGHSGNYFNQTWSPLGASIAGSESTIKFWQRFHSYRDLARRRDGSFIAQPMPHKREGDLGTGNYVNKGPLWNTGGFALSYLIGSERLAMLGRRDSVFAANAPAELKPALDLFRAKDFTRAAEAAAELKDSTLPRVSKLAAQLEGVANRNLSSIELTLADMNANLQSGDLYTLKYQLLGIESLLNPADNRLKDFKAALEAPTAEETLALGKIYHDATKGTSMGGEKGFNFVANDIEHQSRARSGLEQVAKKTDTAYGKSAAALLDSVPFNAMNEVIPLVTLKTGSEHALRKTHTLSSEFEVEDPLKIDHLFLNYLMVNKMKVQLNGTTILNNTMESVDKRPINLLLKPLTRELLRPGKNTITIELVPGGNGCEVSLRGS